MSDDVPSMADYFPFDAESIAAALAHTAMAQGDIPSVTALAVSTPCFGEIICERWNGAIIIHSHSI
jgi:hypothetical protein